MPPTPLDNQPAIRRFITNVNLTLLMHCQISPEPGIGLLLDHKPYYVLFAFPTIFISFMSVALGIYRLQKHHRARQSRVSVTRTTTLRLMHATFALLLYCMHELADDS